ncbi:MAG TPA: endolytic transglycosylase MltG [Gemmatimonadetes bacterium]|nr:endolytic transglycosylase MltG [Gemmatimonadota bacterium]
MNGPVMSARRPRRSVVLATLGLLALGSVVLGLSARGSGENGPPVEVTIPPGASFNSVVDTLLKRGILSGGRSFRLVARLTGADRQIRSGRYELVPGSPRSEILEALTSGRVMTFGMTIPEGFTIADMVSRVAETVDLPTETVRARLADPAAHEGWAVPGPGLEGYLFPDTYLFARGVSLDVVIDAMVKRYRSVWTDPRNTRLEELDMSENELMTLASIIQAEAAQVADMPTISAVYHNRLRLGYRLEADPTVLYALGGHRERLLYAAMDSVADHPYNTYTQRGLPPGPIAAPGEAAIQAALYPADVSFLYFVARPGGSHIFTNSLAEHNQAREVARRERDAAANP